MDGYRAKDIWGLHFSQAEHYKSLPGSGGGALSLEHSSKLGGKTARG